MKKIKSSQLLIPELTTGAIINDEYTGFREDYLVLHALLKRYQPKRFMEIGTNMGTGTKIIKNALGPDSVVFSLDLPTELAHVSLQHPINEGKGDSVGHKCDLPFIQLRGDSMNFDFEKYYPLDGFYIDGEHVYKNAHHETKEAILTNPKIIIWHDTDIKEVYDGIVDAFAKIPNEYSLFRVSDTRISFALRKYVPANPYEYKGE